MGLQFIKSPDADSIHVVATVRLCLTEDRARLVPDTDPDARWLFCTPGAAISRVDAKRYGLLVEPEPEPEVEPEPKVEAKQAAAPANKARGRAADK